MKKLFLPILLGLGSLTSSIDATVEEVTYITDPKTSRRIVLMGDVHEKSFGIKKENETLVTAANKQLLPLISLVKNIKDSCSFQIEHPANKDGREKVPSMLVRIVNHLNADEYIPCDHRDIKISKILTILQLFIENNVPASKRISDFQSFVTEITTIKQFKDDIEQH